MRLLNRDRGHRGYRRISAPIPVHLKAWYRHNEGITVEGQGVSVWADARNGNDLLQGTDTNRPSLEADGSILFDGVDNFLKADAFTLNQPTTVYLLGKQVTWTANDYIFDGNTSASGIVFQTGTTPSISMYAGSSAAANTDLIIDTYSIMSVIFNGASSELQINNETATTGDAGAGNMEGFTLGRSGAASATYSNIQVKEVIIYNAAHDANQRKQVIAYLNQVGGGVI